MTEASFRELARVRSELAQLVDETEQLHERVARRSAITQRIRAVSSPPESRKPSATHDVTENDGATGVDRWVGSTLPPPPRTSRPPLPASTRYSFISPPRDRAHAVAESSSPPPSDPPPSAARDTLPWFRRR